MNTADRSIAPVDLAMRSLSDLSHDENKANL